MHTIFKDFTFAAAHAIRGHTRGCQNLHGHNYRVRVARVEVWENDTSCAMFEP